MYSLIQLIFQQCREVLPFSPGISCYHSLSRKEMRTSARRSACSCSTEQWLPSVLCSGKGLRSWREERQQMESRGNRCPPLVRTPPAISQGHAPTQLPTPSSSEAQAVLRKGLFYSSRVQIHATATYKFQINLFSRIFWIKWWSYLGIVFWNKWQS